MRTLYSIFEEALNNGMKGDVEMNKSSKRSAGFNVTEVLNGIYFSYMFKENARILVANLKGSS